MTTSTAPTARQELRQAVIAALEVAQLGATIISPGDWVTPSESLPAILVRAARGAKEPTTKGVPAFNTTVTIELESRAQGTTGDAAQTAIEALDALIEAALFTNNALLSMVQMFTVDAETEVEARARMHFGATKWQIRCEVFEEFDPITDAPQAVQPVAVPLQGMDIHLDLRYPFDPNGTYPDPPFPAAVLPAPRTSGPDGRDEVYLSIDLPQS